MTEINEADIEEVFFLPVNLFMTGNFNLNIVIPFKADALQIFNVGAVDTTRAVENHISIRSNLPLQDPNAFIITISCGGGGVLGFFESVKMIEPYNQLFLLDNTQFIDGTYNFSAFNIDNQLITSNIRFCFIMKFMKFKQ